MVIGFESTGRSSRAWLVLGALLLWCGAASARIEPMKMSGGASQFLSFGTAQSGLTEHLVRQLLAADPSEQERLLGSMVRQVQASLVSASGDRTTLPDALLVGRLKNLLEQKRPPAEWIQRLDVWVGVATRFEWLRADMVAQRVGIDDHLIRANTALNAGDLVQFTALLDAEIQRSERVLLAASSERKPTLRRQLADQLMLRRFFAELRLQPNSTEDADRVLELRRGGEDSNVVALLLMTVDSALLANKADRSIALLHSLRGMAEERSAEAPSELYWPRVRWLARATTAAVHLGRNEKALALTEFVEANRLLENSDIRSVRDPGVKFMVWLTLFNSAVLSSGMNPERLSELDGSILEFASGFTRTSPSRSEAWLALAGSELLSGFVAVSSGKLDQAERHLFACLNALDRYGALTTVATNVALIRLSALTSLGHLKVQQKAWVELLPILKSAEQLAGELSLGSKVVPELDPFLYSVHAHRALAYSNLDKKGEALASLEQALVIAERHVGEVSDVLDWEFVGWRAHVDIAEMLTGAKSLERGLRHRKRAAELARKAVERKPGRADWEDRYWDSLNELGDVLNDAGDTSAAFEVAKASLAVAQRNAAGSGADSDWSRNVFLSHWQLGTIERRRSNQQNALQHSEAAARLARDRYALDRSAQFVLIDRWLIENRLGSIRSSLGGDQLALQFHQAALSVAEEALQSSRSDDWIENAATSHERIARIFSDRQDWASSLRHSQAGAALSGERVVANDVRFEALREHWMHQFHVGKMHLMLKEHREARAALTLARDLVRRHWDRFSGEDLWRQAHWFNEQEFGRLEEAEGNLGLAGLAYARARSIAEESRTGTDDVMRDWLAREIESLTPLTRVQSVQSMADAPHYSNLLATRVRDLQAADQQNRRRISARKAFSQVLADIGLSMEQTLALPKPDLLARMQDMIDSTLDVARVNGITREQSEQIQRLQNALFAARQLPD